jgi:hypothetical protein
MAAERWRRVIRRTLHYTWRACSHVGHRGSTRVLRNAAESRGFDQAPQAHSQALPYAVSVIRVRSSWGGVFGFHGGTATSGG